VTTPTNETPHPDAGGTPGGGAPEGRSVDPAAGGAAPPDAVVPDVAAQDAVAPDVAAQDATAPDVAAQDATAPDVAAQDAAAQHAAPDSSAAHSDVPAPPAGAGVPAPALAPPAPQRPALRARLRAHPVVVGAAGALVVGGLGFGSGFAAGHAAGDDASDVADVTHLPGFGDGPRRFDGDFPAPPRACRLAGLTVVASPSSIRGRRRRGRAGSTDRARPEPCRWWVGCSRYVRIWGWVVVRVWRAPARRVRGGRGARGGARGRRCGGGGCGAGGGPG